MQHSLPAIPSWAVDLIDQIPMEDRDTKGDVYEYNPNGLSGMFSDGEAGKIVEILDEIRLNAAA